MNEVFVLVYYEDPGHVNITYYCGYSINGIPVVSRLFHNAALYLHEAIAIEVNNQLNNIFEVEIHAYD